MSQNAKEWIKDIVFAIVIGLIIIQFIKPTIVKEHSMMPTLNENDYIFLSKQSYTFGEPKYGDIVVFHSDLKTAEGKEKMLIKRIIGLPGDVISIADGVVFRNGQPLDEPYTLEQYTSTIMSDITVPEDSLFVMGDNRQNSIDSRDPDVGCIEQSRLVGKAFLRLYPFDKIGLLK
ncbi:signal peptidase I [Anaerovorax sp. IOR16]|uniref:signal peptidase I n=1 Tax=Anaerovorax sp. IOR16 TaxID=2773458 RepID=UPI0019D0BAF1|nr:signal peptidase I [Anaerovorax sp. IOR16]